ncbi:MAG TPA: alpha/beta hydrolase [Thermoleophilia bacterium]|nr:alpha/beta hydrolase [Thermoleophilia bacterium]
MPFHDALGLFYTDEGSGPPVVFVHGLGLGHGLWAEQAPLAAEFRVITYDARGCGTSRVPPTGYDYPDLSRELLGLLDLLEIDKAHLVGHSRGGGVIMETGLQNPERVASLFFVDSVLRGFPWSDEFTSTMRRAAEVAQQSGPRAAFDQAWTEAGIFSWVRTRRPEVYQRLLELCEGWSGAEWLDTARYPKQAVSDIDRLADISIPTFVLSGQEDMHDFVEIANMLAWWIPGAIQKSLVGVGHFPMLENPHETNLYLRSFLRRVVGLRE